MSTLAVCGACGAAEGTALFSARLLSAPEPMFTIVACRSRGVGRTHPRPGPAEVRRFYDIDYWGGTGAKLAGPIERVRRALARRRARAVSGAAAPGSHVLDIGCGDGELVIALRERRLEWPSGAPLPHGAKVPQ